MQRIGDLPDLVVICGHDKKDKHIVIRSPQVIQKFLVLDNFEDILNSIHFFWFRLFRIVLDEVILIIINVLIELAVTIELLPFKIMQLPDQRFRTSVIS